MSWKVIYTKWAQRDARRIHAAGLRAKVEDLIRLIQTDPHANPPPFAKVRGDLSGSYSRRTNIHHRLVYTVNNDTKTVKISRMWTHYE